jgi:hypothetical protein
VTVHAATGTAHLAAAAARPGASSLGRLSPGALDPRFAWAAIALAGEAAGDVVVGCDGSLALADGTAVLLDGVPAGEGGAPLRVGRDDLTGTGVAGVGGLRLLVRGPARSVLRLGPPPAARWAVGGLRSVAVFVGKLTLVDGEEGLEVRAGEVAFVADPSATLYVQAGNDAAVAIGFAGPDPVVRLG